ncbi:hypothetical protein CYMTET_32444 [Cymbomonas tetramitiformis]|uniref:CSD domain-containing protein n=1 Tax=Cymbomonas tetramitiformis TaxID=36881 RepID=A0AAE0KS71_9CHLO|nr:hypothetical protein CYMTET_32444 [Cymbomonas tetramitiformis]
MILYMISSYYPINRGTAGELPCEVRGLWSDMQSGAVKLWNVQKGFGFITPDAGGADVFVHQSDIEMEGFRCLCESEPVQYTLTIGEDGRSKASSVKGPGGGPLQGVWGGVEYSKGIVAAWSADRGFGFITPSDGGPDIFVHQSVIHANGFRSLGKAMSVEYTAEESDGKPKATKDMCPKAFTPGCLRRCHKGCSRT